MATISHITLPDGTDYNIQATGILYGVVDGTSTRTALTVTIPGITTLYDGLCILVKNNVAQSNTNCTLNVNGLGAKQIHYSTALDTAVTTQWAATATALFYYDSTRDSGNGAWVYYYGYDTNTNTIGYQIRTNSMSLPMTSVTYRYRILFTSADDAHFVPATNSTSTNATSARTVCQDPINPFGRIVYYGTTASVAAGSRPSASALWDQYAFSFGYSFQKSPNYVLTSWKPIYLKCAPQSDGSAIIDSTTPFVQDLPTAEDGKIYIFLGVAYSETQIELLLHHPVYWYKNGHVRQWTNSNKTEQTYNGNSSMSYTSYTNSIVNGHIAEFSCTSGSNKAFIQAAYDDSGECPVITLGGYTSTNGNKNSLFVDPSGEITIHNLSTPLQSTDAATKGYVDNNFMTGMTVLSYGTSTWSDFITAYNSNRVIYCRASSNSNPASGSQTRLAFMAYANNVTTPTEVEFQYYRSVSTHTESQQGDQVFVYKLNKNSGWSVTVREAYTKIATGTGLSKSYSNGTLTLSYSGATPPSAATADPLMDGTAAVGSSTKYAKEDHVHPSDTSKVSTTFNGKSSMTYDSYTNTITNDYIAQMKCESGTNGAFVQAYYDDSASSPTIYIGAKSGNIYTASIYVDPSGIQIYGLVAPTTNDSAATKAYVDSAVSSVEGLPAITSSDNGKVLMVVNGAWAAANLPTYQGGVS